MDGLRVLRPGPRLFDANFAQSLQSASPSRKPDSQGEIMTAELHGRIGIVTGGTSGIGRDTAVLFAKAGAKVVVAGRRESEGKETLDLVRAAGGDGLFVKTDVSRAADVRALVLRTVEKFGRLDVAFNNAGIEGSWSPVAEQSEGHWIGNIDINLNGVWPDMESEAP